MGETKLNDHDKVVLEVGLFLLSMKGLDTVHADLDAKHGFKRKLVLSVKPPEVLSAFVPTGTLFEPMVVFSNFDWKTPDLAVTRGGFTYVLELYSENDPYTSVCRKIETVIANSDIANSEIANSEKHKIVGMAVIEIPCTRKAERAAEQLKRMRGTFHRLFGKSIATRCPDKCRTYLEPLFLHPAVRHLYGKINWDAVLEMSIKDNNWAKTLCKHVDAAFKAKTLLAQRAPTS